MQEIFLSYARVDRARVEYLLKALRAVGLRVWIDEERVDDFKSITRSIKDGLTGSQLLVAFYSKAYPKSYACQWELTAAFLAGQKEGNASGRIIVINPENTWLHVNPVELKDASGLLWDSANSALIGQVADKIRKAAAKKEEMGAVIGGPTPPWVGMQPTGATQFIGRVDKMWELHSALAGPDYPVILGEKKRPVIAVGIGGIGKTLLVEEYAMRFGAAYPGGVFWMQATGKAKEAGDAAHPDAQRLLEFQGALSELRRPRARDLLEAKASLGACIDRRGLPCLWIVDDLPSGLGASEFRDWIVPSPLARVLVTSRSQEYSDLAITVAVERLGKEEGAALLTRKLKREVGGAEQESVYEIVEALGGLPLALDVGGASIAISEGPDCAGIFLKALSSPTVDELELASKLGGVLPTGHEKSIAATLMRSINETGSEGRDYLRLAAVLSSQAVPHRVVGSCFERVGSLERDAAFRRVQVGLDDTRKRSLSEMVQLEPPADSVHVLVARTLAFSKSDSEQCESLRAAAVIVLGKALAAASRRGVPGFSLEAAHAATLAADGTLEEQLFLKRGLSSYYHMMGAIDAARLLGEEVVEGARALYGEKARDTIDAKGQLGGILHSCGRYEEALILEKEVLAARARFLGPSHQDTLAAATNAASSMGAAGDLKAAGELSKKVADASLCEFGELARNTVVARQNYGSALQKLGRLEEALEIMQEAVEILERQKWSGWEEDLRTAKSNLGLLLRARGDYERAIQLQEEVFQELNSLFGGKHPSTLTAMNNLALSKCDAGMWRDARELYQQVVGRSLDVLGPKHPHTLHAQSNYAAALLQWGESSEGLALCRSVCRSCADVLGSVHPFTVTVRHNLAHALEDGGAFGEAAIIHEEVLRSSRDSLGWQHPHTLVAKSSWAGVVQQSGDIREAVALHEEVLEERKEVLGESHPDTLNGENNLAFAYFEQGRFERALDMFERLVIRRSELLGDSHPDTLNSRNSRAACLQCLGRAEEAVGHLEILAVDSGSLGQRHPVALQILQNYSGVLRKLGRHAKASELEKEALERAIKAHGENSPEALQQRLGHAEGLRQEGVLGGASPLFREVLSVVGGTHEDMSRFVVGAAWGLTQCLKAEGQFAEAEEVEGRYLQWLLEREPASLSWKRQKVRASLGVRCSKEETQS